MQTFHRGGGLAVENEFVAQRLHAEHSNSVLHQNRENFFLEAVEMSVHDIQGHLHRIEAELVREGSFQHFEMDVGTLVPGEADVADLSALLGFQNSFHPASGGKYAVGIAVANHFVELQQVDVVGLQAAQG